MAMHPGPRRSATSEIPRTIRSSMEWKWRARFIYAAVRHRRLSRSLGESHGWPRAAVTTTSPEISSTSARVTPGTKPGALVTFSTASRIWWFAWHAKTLAGDTIGRSVGQSGARSLRPDRGQHPALARHRARTGEEPNNHLERFHSRAYGRPRWHGLLHGRRAGLARPGDVLGSIFHSPGQPACVDRGNHRSSGCEWMSQVARNATLEELGYLRGCRYVFARSRLRVLR
jgi:hypothetical protein